MELFRKLREKPRGLDFHLSIHFLLDTLYGVSIWVYSSFLQYFWLSFCFSDQRCSGDGQEVVRLVVQAVQFYEKKLKDFYTHLRYSHIKC